MSRFSEKIKDYSDVVNSENEVLPYVIENLLPEHFLLLLTGRRGRKKSLLSLIMALSIARGINFLGWKTMKSPVLYVDMENSRKLLAKRLRLLVGLGGKVTPIIEGITFLLSEDIGSLNIEKDESALKEDSEGKVLIIDSLAKAHKKEENSNSEMTQVMQRLINLARANYRALILVHNQGKNQDLGARGASAIEDTSDIVVEISTSSDLVNLTCVKHRDAKESDVTRTVRVTFSDNKITVSDAEGEEIVRFIKRLRELPEDSLSSQNRILEALKGRYPHHKILTLLKRGVDSGFLSITRGESNVIRYSLDGCSLCHQRETCMLTPEQRKLCEGFQ